MRMSETVAAKERPEAMMRVPEAVTENDANANASAGDANAPLTTSSISNATADAVAASDSGTSPPPAQTQPLLTHPLNQSQSQSQSPPNQHAAGSAPDQSEESCHDDKADGQAQVSLTLLYFSFIFF